MGIMAKFKKARASGGAFKYFEEGEHYARVNSIKQFDDRNDVECVAMDAVILHTTSPLMKVGETRNWMTGSDKKDVYAPNVKALLMAAHNMTEEEIDSMDDEAFEQLCKLTFEEQQAGAGVILKVTTVKQRKKDAKNKPWEECTPKDIYNRNALEYFASVDHDIKVAATGEIVAVARGTVAAASNAAAQ